MSEKALTVKQPWAYLICSGVKDIENRTWRTNYRGRIYIHASAIKKDNTRLKDYQHLLSEEQYNKVTSFFGKDVLFRLMDSSAIVGHVDIVDCVEDHTSIWAEHWVLKDWHNGTWGGTYDQKVYNWVLANPVLFNEPIKNVKGALSFWDCTNYLK